MSKSKRGNGMVNPDEAPKEKRKKKIKVRNPNELIEREEEQILTEDGRELLKD